VRVVYLTTGCFDKGGISRYCRYQICALRELFGVENVVVLSLLGPDGTGFETPLAVDWHGGRGGIADKIAFTRRAVSAAVRLRPAVVHVAHVNLTPLAHMIGRLSGARTLLNVYGLEIWSGLSRSRRAAMRRMDRIVADCHFTARFVEGEAMHAATPDVIWDCVDLDRFQPGECSANVRQKYAIPEKRDGFVVLTLGRLAREAAHKGYDRLLEVFAAVCPAAPSARLVIAGKGSDRERLEALAASLGIAGRVTFTGPVDEADLADVYRAASVFSLVSDRGPGRGEGIPLTPLEAMACGVPVIVGNQDGSQEAVSNESSGYVVDPFDFTAHAGCILALIKDEALLRAKSQGARERAADCFGYRRFVDQHRQLYLGEHGILRPAVRGQ
jgi:phosphatidyl-myo-inositol dimannoside synthase